MDLRLAISADALRFDKWRVLWRAVHLILCLQIDSSSSSEDDVPVRNVMIYDANERGGAEAAEPRLPSLENSSMIVVAISSLAQLPISLRVRRGNGGEAPHHRQQHQYAPASVGGLRPSTAVAAQRDGSSRSEPIGGVIQRAQLFTPSQPPPSTIKRRSKSSSSSSSSPSLSPPHHVSSSSRDFAPTSSVIRSTLSTSRSPPSGVQNTFHITHRS